MSEAGHLQPFLTEAAEWVFKPVYSRFASHTKVGPSAAEVLTIEPTPACRWIAQRRIFGVEHSTYGVAHAGRLRAHVIYRSAYRVGLGSGIYFSACAQLSSLHVPNAPQPSRTSRCTTQWLATSLSTISKPVILTMSILSSIVIH